MRLLHWCRFGLRCRWPRRGHRHWPAPGPLSRVRIATSRLAWLAGISAHGGRKEPFRNRLVWGDSGIPEHLPRETVVYDSDDHCPDCSEGLRPMGEDVSETLEYVPEHWKVIRHRRPKYTCQHCQTVVQAPAVSRPIPRSYAGPGLLAHVLVGKYCDHLPLHRQSRIYAREGIHLDVSTLAAWVGQSSALCEGLVEPIGSHVMAADKPHADDTPVPVLAPGRGRTKTARLWTYVRDGRGGGDRTPPAVCFRYTPDRKGERARSSQGLQRHAAG